MQQIKIASILAALIASTPIVCSSTTPSLQSQLRKEQQTAIRQTAYTIAQAIVDFDEQEKREHTKRQRLVSSVPLEHPANHPTGLRAQSTPPKLQIAEENELDFELLMRRKIRWRFPFDRYESLSAVNRLMLYKEVIPDYINIIVTHFPLVLEQAFDQTNFSSPEDSERLAQTIITWSPIIAHAIPDQMENIIKKASLLAQSGISPDAVSRMHAYLGVHNTDSCRKARKLILNHCLNQIAQANSHFKKQTAIDKLTAISKRLSKDDNPPYSFILCIPKLIHQVLNLPNYGRKHPYLKMPKNVNLELCRKIAAAVAIWKEFIPDRGDENVRNYIIWATRHMGVVIDKEKSDLSIDDLRNVALLNSDLIHTQRSKKIRAAEYFNQLRTIPDAMDIADFYNAALAETQLALDYYNNPNNNQNLISALDYIGRASALIRETHAEKVKRLMPLAILLRDKYALASNKTKDSFVALLKTMTADCVVAMEQRIALEEMRLKAERDEEKSSLDARQEELEHEEIKSSSSSLPSLPAISSSPLRLPWPPRDLNAILPVVDDKVFANHENIETCSFTRVPLPNGFPTAPDQPIPSAPTISEDELD